ncbi:MAG: energy-coupling factor transporter transmembrane component T [Saccharofermentanales bacterium]
MKTFSSYHPSVLMAYFAAVIAITMFTGHPVMLALALAGGFCLSLASQEFARSMKNLAFSALFFMVISLTNPLFSHKGVTVLFFLNSNPVTLESFFYGMGIGAMVVGVMYWFRNYSAIMTTEKFLYLFGRFMPRLTLIFSMVIRFIPLFTDQIRKVTNSQKALGGFSEEGYIAKVKSGISVFSVMITWALEMAIETSDSMRSRGYGIQKRSSFSIYRFAARDLLMLIVLAGLAVFIFVSMSSDSLYFSYYPGMTPVRTDITAIGAYAAFACLVFLPSLIEIKEIVKWKYSLSGI